jgi:hypothetical protein
MPAAGGSQGIQQHHPVQQAGSTKSQHSPSPSPSPSSSPSPVPTWGQLEGQTPSASPGVYCSPESPRSSSTLTVLLSSRPDSVQRPSRASTRPEYGRALLHLQAEAAGRLADSRKLDI